MSKVDEYPTATVMQSEPMHVQSEPGTRLVLIGRRRGKYGSQKCCYSSFKWNCMLRYSLSWTNGVTEFM